MENIQNAKITQARMGFNEKGEFVLTLLLEGNGWGGVYGEWPLDAYDEELQRRAGTEKGLTAVMELLKTLGAYELIGLSGIFVRCRGDFQPGGRITGVGHILRDQWFDFEEYFGEEKDGEERERE